MKKLFIIISLLFGFSTSAFTSDFHGFTFSVNKPAVSLIKEYIEDGWAVSLTGQVANFTKEGETFLDIPIEQISIASKQEEKITASGIVLKPVYTNYNDILVLAEAILHDLGPTYYSFEYKDNYVIRTFSTISDNGYKVSITSSGNEDNYRISLMWIELTD